MAGMMDALRAAMKGKLSEEDKARMRKLQADSEAKAKAQGKTLESEARRATRPLQPLMQSTGENNAARPAPRKKNY